MKQVLSDHKKSFLFFLLLSLLFYGNSIRNSFSFDDSYVTVTNFPEGNRKYTPNNKRIAEGIKGIPTLWQSRYGHGKGSAFDYRPVVTTLFAIEYSFFGQSPHLNHFVNVLLYATSVFLLFILLKRILAAYPYRESFALVCCLIFLAHPLHTEVVDSIKSCDELLGVVFGFLCTWQMLNYFEHKKISALILAVIFFLLAIFSKLSSAVFIGFIPLALYFFNLGNKKQIAGFIIISLLLYAAQTQFRHYLVAEEETRILYHFENPMVGEHLSLMARALFALKTLGVYIKLLFLPYPLRFYYGASMMTTDVSAGDLDVWISILFVAGASYFCYRTKNKIAFFGLLFFLISVAPMINFVKPVAGIVGERLVFAPSVGFMIFITAVLFQYLKNKDLTGFALLKARPVVVATVLLPVFLIQDWSRAADWKDELTLFEHDAPYLEKSAGANNILANKYSEQMYATSNVNEKQVLVERCWKHYNLALQADSSLFSASNNAGVIALSFLHKPELALGYFEAALRAEPDYSQVHENLGDCYTQLGRKDKAQQEYEKAIASDPKLYRSYQGLVAIYEENKQYDKEKSVLAKAVANFQGSYFFTKKEGDVLKLENKSDLAAGRYEVAYGLNPNKELAGILAETFAGLKDTAKAAFYQNKYNSFAQ